MTTKPCGCGSHNPGGERHFHAWSFQSDGKQCRQSFPGVRTCSCSSPSARTEPLSVDLYRGEGSLLVIAEVPGFSREEIDLDVSGELLRIEGRRKSSPCCEDPGDRCRIRIRECIPDGFVRCVKLSVEVDTDSASATLDRGLLSIVLPLAQTASSGRMDLDTD